MILGVPILKHFRVLYSLFESCILENIFVKKMNIKDEKLILLGLGWLVGCIPAKLSLNPAASSNLFNCKQVPLHTIFHYHCSISST